MRQKLLILNLISILVVAFGLTTFIHELAHALAAKLLGVDSVLFHTYVSFDNSALPANHELIILAGGPFVSFIQAILFLILLQRRGKLDLMGMFYLWMGIIGMVVFLGYVMMGPFVIYGDTGKIYAILATPSYISLSLAALALVGMILFFRKLTPSFIDFLSNMKAMSGFEKSRSMYLFFVLPILAGTIINTLISLPAPTMMSIAFPLFLPLIMLPSTIRIGKSSWVVAENPTEESESLYIAYWPIFSMIVIIIVSRILSTGISI